MTDRTAYKLRVTTVRGRARAQLAAIRKDRLSKRKHRQATEDLALADRPIAELVEDPVAAQVAESVIEFTAESGLPSEPDAPAAQVLDAPEAFAADAESDPAPTEPTSHAMPEPDEPAEDEAAPGTAEGDAGIVAAGTATDPSDAPAVGSEKALSVQAEAPVINELSDEGVVPDEAPGSVSTVEEAPADAEDPPADDPIESDIPTHVPEDPGTPIIDAAPVAETFDSQDAATRTGAPSRDAVAADTTLPEAAPDTMDPDPEGAISPQDRAPFPEDDSDAASQPEASQAAARSDLFEIPGIGTGLVWMLQSAGIHTLGDLARAETRDLEDRLGMISRLLDLDYFVDFARARDARP